MARILRDGTAGRAVFKLTPTATRWGTVTLRSDQEPVIRHRSDHPSVAGSTSSTVACRRSLISKTRGSR